MAKEKISGGLVVVLLVGIGVAAVTLFPGSGIAEALGSFWAWLQQLWWDAVPEKNANVSPSSINIGPILSGAVSVADLATTTSQALAKAADAQATDNAQANIITGISN